MMNANNTILIVAVLLVLVTYGFLMIFNKPMYKMISVRSPLLTPVRVALCISGEIRDLSNIPIFISQQILPYSTLGSKCDIFIHASFRNRDIKNQYIELLKPKVVIDRRVNSSNLLNIVFCRIFELHEIVKQYEKDTGEVYDLYIRSRPDIVLSKPVMDIDITKALEGKLCCTRILTSLHVLTSIRFVSDTYFLCNKSTMDHIANIYSYIKQYDISARCNNPEALLYNYLRMYKTPLHFIESEISFTDYNVNTSNKKSMLKMLSKTKDLPLISLSNCSLG